MMADKLRTTSLRPKQAKANFNSNTIEHRLAKTGIIANFHDNRQEYLETQEYASDDNSQLYSKPNDSIERQHLALQEEGSLFSQHEKLRGTFLVGPAGDRVHPKTSAAVDKRRDPFAKELKSS